MLYVFANSFFGEQIVLMHTATQMYYVLKELF